MRVRSVTARLPAIMMSVADWAVTSCLETLGFIVALSVRSLLRTWGELTNN